MRQRAKFEVGEYVRIWSGHYEDFNTTVRSVTWVDDGRRMPGWHYGTDYGDYHESGLVKASDRRGWHYDRNGYCDNPGRGY